MNYSILWFLLFSAGFFGVIRLMELLRSRYHLPSELTRKIAHILSSLSSILFMILFDDYLYVLVLGIFFFLVLYFGKKWNKFKSIDAIGRKSAGSFLLPLSISFIFVFSNISGNSLHFILPLLILGIADPIAGMAGTYIQKFNSEIYLFGIKTGKTKIGTSFFFLSTFVISLFLLKIQGYSGMEFLLLLVFITVVATFVELISSNGLDNFTVPMIVLVILYNEDYLFSMI